MRMGNFQNDAEEACCVDGVVIDEAGRLAMLRLILVPAFRGWRSSGAVTLCERGTGPVHRACPQGLQAVRIAI